MFKLFTAIAFIVSLNGFCGYPPTSLSGQKSSSKPTTFNFKAPNYTATQTNGTESLIETGSKNILANPSFEHSTADTSWTNNGTEIGVVETSVVVDGAKSLYFNPSSETINLVQSSTLYAAQLADGVQCLAQVRIKSAVALSVCAVQAGTVSTTDCVTTNTDSKWGLYKVPFICGATSNGISIASSGNVTGTTYIDDAFVGAINLESQNGACITADCTTSFSAKVSSTGTVSGENVDWISGNCTNANPRVCTLSVTLNNSPNCVVVDKQNTDNSNATISAISSTSVSIFTRTTGVTSQAHDAEIICTKSGSDFTQAEAKKTGNVFTIQCGANCVDTFSAIVSSAGVVSSENADWINGNAAVSDTSLFDITLNSGIASQALLCQVTTGSTGANIIGTIVSTTSSAISIRTQNQTTNAKAAAGFYITCQKTGSDFVATRTIVGSFNEVVTAPGITKPKTFSYRTTAACTTGTCAGENLGSIAVSSSFSSTGTYSISIPSGACSNTPFCEGGIRAFVSNSNKCSISFNTSTSGQASCTNSAGSAVNEGFQFLCICEAP